MSRRRRRELRSEQTLALVKRSDGDYRERLTTILSYADQTTQDRVAEGLLSHVDHPRFDFLMSLILENDAEPRDTLRVLERFAEIEFEYGPVHPDRILHD